jgi:hypothetical protein
MISCSLTDKVYIGQTTDTLRIRWNSHKSEARRYGKYLDGDKSRPFNKRGTCSKLYRAMHKYAIKNFRMILVEEEYDNDLEMLDVMEMQHIEEFDSVINGYNLKSGGNNSRHSDETKALLRVINAENMKTTFTQFRKHKILDDLPIHCIYIKKPRSEGLAINKHPLCSRKEFMINKYGTMENTKMALLEYLVQLETIGLKKPRLIKKDLDLPKGMRKIKNSYFIDKTINGNTYRKAFSGKSDQENKINAIAYLKALI